MSRDAAAKTVEPPAPKVPEVSLFDASSSPANPAQSQQVAFDPWNSPTVSVPVAAPVQASWDPFESPANVQTPAQVSAPSGTSNPWGQALVPPAQKPPVVSQGGWTAFDEAFEPVNSPPVNPAPQMNTAPTSVAPPSDFFDLPMSSQLAEVQQPINGNIIMSPTNQTVANDDFFGGDLLSPSNTNNMPEQNLDAGKSRKTPTDFLGLGANLVNFDNLVSRPNNTAVSNPFMSSGAKKTNPFQKTGPGKFSYFYTNFKVLTISKVLVIRKIRFGRKVKISPLLLQSFQLYLCHIL